MERNLNKRHFWQAGAATISRCLVVSFSFWLICSPAWAVTFTASLERDTISLGDGVGLALTFDGAQPQDTPTIPSVANLQIRYIGPASQFSFVNGQVSSKVTHNFSVTPKQAGDYTIPAVSADVNGRTLTTQPLRLKVLKPNAPPPDATTAGNQAAFLRLVLPKTNIYLGEIMTGTFQLYLRDGVDGWGQFQFTGTPTEGFTLGKPVEGQRQRVQIGNATFTVIPLIFTISPIKTGPLSIGPVTAGVSYSLPPRNQREAFFGGQRAQVNLATEIAALQCWPVPGTNAPPGFTGAVGDYAMTVSVGPTNVATGDPITVRVQISGRGDLDRLTLPEQVAWSDFKSYPPTAKVETTDQLGLQGTKTFEQIISPQNSDIQELPPLTFSYFDPETKLYRTLAHPAVKLTVRPGGSAPAPVVAASAANSNDMPPPQQDIVPIKPRLGTVTRPASSLRQQQVYLALNALPTLALVGALVWRKRTDALANNPRLRRQRQVAGKIQAGLERLRALAAQNQSDGFFAELVHLLQEKLGERLDCPASAITEAVIEEKLRPRGLPDTTLEELHELFQLCNLARYAPIKSSQELTAIIPRLESALRKLEEVKA
jgi:hypothetical protein